MFQTTEDAVNSALRLDKMSACGRGIRDLPHVIVGTRQKDVNVLLAVGRWEAAVCLQ